MRILFRFSCLDFRERPPLPVAHPGGLIQGSPCAKDGQEMMNRVQCTTTPDAGRTPAERDKKFAVTEFFPFLLIASE